MTQTLSAAPAGARALLALITLGCGGYAVLVLSENADDRTLRWAYPAIIIASAVAATWRAVARRDDRTAWILMSAAAWVWGLAQIVYFAWLFDLESPPAPSVADVLWLSYYPLTIVALALLVRRRVGRVPVAYWLDAAIGVAATGAIVAVITADLVASAGGATAAQKVVAAGYPIGDFLMLLLVVGAMILGGSRLSAMWLSIAAAQVLFVVADTAYLLGVGAGTWTDNTPIAIAWPVGGLLVAVAAWCRPDGSIAALASTRWHALATPAVCSGMAVGVLLWDHFERLPRTSVLLAVLALVLLVLRLITLLRENFSLVQVSHQEAHTDELTGLGNRRALLADLEHACRRDAEPGVLSLFDLDGFKEYNDAFGHLAGDVVLERLGHRLGTVAAGLGGRAYRLIGDEFGVLATRNGRSSAQLALWLSAALAESGQGFTIGASWGTADLPCIHGAVEAFHTADRGMYAGKAGFRPSATQQTIGVLLAAERERDPSLGDHTRGVAEMAAEISMQFDLPAAEVEQVRLAAELHDIGKIAIPDRILSKPGPLDDEDWAFMQQHTLIGERILLAAPDLEQVAGLVRASHERWDGKGYPDRIAGAQIPLGARIVAVCDAFDAMISDRPYSPARQTTDAMAEIRRCAGAQFDPAVVAAFDAVIEKRNTLLQVAQAA